MKKSGSALGTETSFGPLTLVAPLFLIDQALEFGVLEQHDCLSVLDFASLNYLERVVQSQF
jgi:hypothetical protein